MGHNGSFKPYIWWAKFYLPQAADMTLSRHSSEKWPSNEWVMPVCHLSINLAGKCAATNSQQDPFQEGDFRIGL